MSTRSNAVAALRATSGLFNFMDDSVAPSLYRNGRVLTRRDADGSDGGTEGVNLERREMQVHDGRAPGAPCTLAANGFELLERPLEDPDLDFFDHDQVVRRYYPSCARLVEEATGARAYAFDHNVRSASGKQSKTRISGGQQVQGPAHVVHGDYTLFSAPERLRQLARPPSGNDTLKPYLADGAALIDPTDAARALGPGGRFAIINVWRSIVPEPVETHPLALCDGQTVKPEDLVVFEIHYQDRIGENYFAKHAPRHTFYYFPEMTRDEALLIKQWDSAGPLARSDGREADSSDPGAPCTFSFHTAFDDPATRPDAPDRWSTEVRCMVIYD
ncbi:MAG: CmcJ/NvfI family oxidoreductase [Gammaproteobacteria bacterium]